MKTIQSISRQSIFKLVLGAFLFLTVPLFSSAQATYTIAPSKDMVMVAGTSNVHDWEMKASSAESRSAFTFTNGKLTAIENFSFTVATKSLKSGKKSMDKRTYETLKANQHPNITYNLKATEITETGKNQYLVKTTGNLTIAGVSQPSNLQVNITVNPDNTLNCTGTEKLKLTDFNIDPPSYMAGAMKVGNELNIAFNLNYKK